MNVDLTAIRGQSWQIQTGRPAIMELMQEVRYFLVRYFHAGSSLRQSCVIAYAGVIGRLRGLLQCSGAVDVKSGRPAAAASLSHDATAEIRRRGRWNLSWCCCWALSFVGTVSWCTAVSGLWCGGVFEYIT